MKMDWKKESENNVGMLYPEGTYKVRVDSYEHVIATTGTPQIRWKCIIEAPDQYKGKRMTEHNALTEKALWKVANFVKACGLNVDALGTAEVGSIAFNKVLDNCKGRTLYMHVTIGIGRNEKRRNEIDDYQPDTEQDAAQMQEPTEDVPDFLKE